MRSGVRSVGGMRHEQRSHITSIEPGEHCIEDGIRYIENAGRDRPWLAIQQVSACPLSHNRLIPPQGNIGNLEAPVPDRKEIHQGTNVEGWGEAPMSANEREA